MKGFVLDASVAACWAFSDESHEVASRALDLVTNEPAWVPQLWWYEVRNTLLMSERRGRIAPTDTAVFLRDLVEMLIEIDDHRDGEHVLALARTHTLTIYDAAYLEAAIRLALPLATLDKDLRKAAKKARVPLI